MELCKLAFLLCDDLLEIPVDSASCVANLDDLVALIPFSCQLSGSRRRRNSLEQLRTRSVPVVDG
jgi:hypothetical protein